LGGGIPSLADGTLGPVGILTSGNDAAIMKKKTEPLDEMRSHYDFDYSKSRPNRFAVRPKLGSLRVAASTQDTQPLRNDTVRETTAAIRERR